MATEDLKAKVRRVVEDGWNKGNVSVLDENYGANVVYHHPTNPQKGRQGLKKYFTAVRISYPDLHFTIDDLMSAEADKIVMRWTFEGTDTGGSVAFGTPPTGKHIKFTGITIYRFVGGKCVEETEEGDYLGAQKQLKG
jgi:predicted ester cyclase